MNFLWFHLMPYMDLPADFRQNNPSVWVNIDPALFSPERAHQMYNDYFDELEYAAELGFDAVCVNEHHSNAYGLMPSPNLIAMALARRTKDTKICVLGNSIALYNPPDARGRRIRHDRLRLGRAPDCRLSRGHAHGHVFRLWHEPQPTAATLYGSP